MSVPTATIIIRAKNEEENIGRCLSGVLSQKIDKKINVVVIDSGSTDKTLQIVSKFAVKLVQIQPETFTYPYALNIGVKHSEGHYCVFISADAYPADDKWLAALLEPLADPCVAAVSGRQIPVLGVNPIEELELLKQFPADRDSRILSAANCAIRRKLLIDYPFMEQLGMLRIGNRPTIEDGIWRMSIETKGYKTVYQPAAVVYHSHKITGYLKKIFWLHFYTGYAIAYFGQKLYSKEPGKASLLGRVPKTIAYIKNSICHLVRKRHYLCVPLYLVFMLFSFARVMHGYCLGLRDRG